VAPLPFSDIAECNLNSNHGSGAANTNRFACPLPLDSAACLLVECSNPTSAPTPVPTPAVTTPAPTPVPPAGCDPLATGAGDDHPSCCCNASAYPDQPNTGGDGYCRHWDSSVKPCCQGSCTSGSCQSSDVFSGRESART
jgi:hypothetical protein